MARQKDESASPQLLLQAAAAHRLSGALLLHGEEENLKAEALAAIRSAVLSPGTEQLNEAVLEAPSADELIAACETIPFMGDQRLVIVRDAEGLSGRKEADERLLRYIPEVPATCVLVFYHTGRADGKKKLVAALKKDKRVFSFDVLKEKDVVPWVQAAFQREGRECDWQTASRLVFISGTDTSVLQGEVAKLIAFAGERKTLTPADADAIATPCAEYTIFQLVDDVVAGRDRSALVRQRRLQQDGAEDLYVLAMLLRQYRLIQQLKILQYEKVPREEWEDILNTRGYALEQCIRQSRGVTGGQAKRAVALCLDTEFRFKSGQISDRGLAQATLLRLFGQRQGGGAR